MTCMHQALQERVSETLFRSAIYQGLALGFTPPDSTVRDQLRNRWGTLLDAPMTWPRGVRYPLAKASEHLMVTPVEELLHEYAQLFGKPSGCSLRESDYHDGLPEACLADLSEYYEAFGIDERLQRPEDRDGAGHELSFMAILAIREALALSGEWYEELAIVLDAQAKFMRDHLGAWLTRCLTSLRERYSHPFYLYLGEATMLMLERDAMRLNVR